MHVERNGTRIALSSRASFSLQRDDLLVIRTGGGAGFGDPAHRSADRRKVDETQGLS
jgi:N-methylhydantoinase B/oxoprolinase/acetone carboxylase alpha subunit